MRSRGAKEGIHGVQVGPPGVPDLAEEKGSDHPGRTSFLSKEAEVE